MISRERAALMVTLGMLAVALTGCGGLLSSKPSRFFDLDRLPPAVAVRTASGLPIGIDVVELPPGADRREVVVRQADARLEVRGREQWSASLEPLVLHTLAFDLASRLPDGMVILPGQPKPAGGMRGIDVMVEEIAAGPESRVILDVRWTLRDRAGHPLASSHERIEVPVQSLASENIATGLSQALATLADRIVERLPA